MIVLSASRRTDIPAFYMPWFMLQIERGFFEAINPYNGHKTRIPATPEHVHTIVFWSKNFGPFLSEGFGRALVQRGYHLFFNFTINSPHPQLEPGVPPLAQRLKQLEQLCRHHGSATIHWRFDPICYYQDANGTAGNNLDQFATIARHVARLGLKVCITSFVDLYRKVQRRLQAFAGLTLYDPPLAPKVTQTMAMARFLAGLGIQLRLCCEKELLQALPPDTPVCQAACIPNHDLIDLYGPGISLRKDAGQRTAAGCGCRWSKDIGSYALHPCHHNCLFCYANPSSDSKAKQIQRPRSRHCADDAGMLSIE